MRNDFEIRVFSEEDADKVNTALRTRASCIGSINIGTRDRLRGILISVTAANLIDIIEPTNGIRCWVGPPCKKVQSL